MRKREDRSNLTVAAAEVAAAWPPLPLLTAVATVARRSPLPMPMRPAGLEDGEGRRSSCEEEVRGKGSSGLGSWKTWGLQRIHGRRSEKEGGLRKKQWIAGEDQSDVGTAVVGECAATTLDIFLLCLLSTFVRHQVGWGMISMVDAERRLLAKALEDIDNQYFVLLSDSCVPLHNFDYVYDFLIGSRHSFLDCFDDPGPHGVFRYSKNMLPEVRETEFRKGSQWFAIKRQHAMVVIADSLYYKKFRHYCKPGMEEGRNCYADEHYLLTLFHMMDPAGIANWSVTFVDWSEGKWHPRSFRAKDVTYERLNNMTSCCSRLT